MDAICSLVPLTTLGRACCVSKSWNGVISGACFWRFLDASYSSVGEISDDILLGCARKASGFMTTLDISGQEFLSWQSVSHILRLNSRLVSLTMKNVTFQGALLCTGDLKHYKLPLVITTPLRTNKLDVFNLFSYPSIRVTELVIDLSGDGKAVHEVPCPDSADFKSAFAMCMPVIESYPGLKRLDFCGPFSANTFADFVKTVTLCPAIESVMIITESPVDVNGLVAMLPQLTSFQFNGVNRHALFDDASALLFATTLRNSSNLTTLSLVDCKLFDDIDVFTPLLEALVYHPSITHLNVNAHRFTSEQPNSPAVGRLLGNVLRMNDRIRVLHAANFMSRALDCANIIDALQFQNRTLRELDLKPLSAMDFGDFDERRVMPAVVACTSLMKYSGSRKANSISERIVVARAAAMEALARAEIDCIHALSTRQLALNGLELMTMPTVLHHSKVGYTLPFTGFTSAVRVKLMERAADLDMRLAKLTAEKNVVDEALLSLE